MVIQLYVQCGQEGIEVSRHKPTIDTLRSQLRLTATPDEPRESLI